MVNIVLLCGDSFAATPFARLILFANTNALVLTQYDVIENVDADRLADFGKSISDR